MECEPRSARSYRAARRNAARAGASHAHTRYPALREQWQGRRPESEKERYERTRTGSRWSR